MQVSAAVVKNKLSTWNRRQTLEERIRELFANVGICELFANVGICELFANVGICELFAIVGICELFANFAAPPLCAHLRRIIVAPPPPPLPLLLPLPLCRRSKAFLINLLIVAECVSIKGDNEKGIVEKEQELVE